MRNARLDEAQAGIKIARRNNNHRYADDTTLLAESKEEIKSLLMKVKEESEKGGLKLNIQKTKIMASSPITSWQIDGETMETVRDFIFLGSKIIADGDCSHEIKRCLLPGRKAITNLDSILRSRDITLPTKVRTVKALVFPVFMYGCESWTIKRAESWRIDAFELWCWRRLLRVPWTERRCEEPTYWKKILMLGKIAGRRRRGRQRMRCLDGFIDSMDMSLSKLQGMVKDREAWGAIVHGVTKSWTRLSNWTTMGVSLNLHELLVPLEFQDCYYSMVIGA